jgi:hypothetical protein
VLSSTELVGWLVGCLVIWLFDCLVGWLVNDRCSQLDYKAHCVLLSSHPATRRPAVVVFQLSAGTIVFLPQ